MYQVMAKSFTGKNLCLRKGFTTEDAALDHPVKLANWACVWVTETPPTPEPDNSPPPFPWTAEWRGRYLYMMDANGKRFASIWGTTARQEYVAKVLCGLSESEVGAFLRRGG